MPMFVTSVRELKNSHSKRPFSAFSRYVLLLHLPAIDDSSCLAESWHKITCPYTNCLAHSSKKRLHASFGFVTRNERSRIQAGLSVLSSTREQREFND